MLSRPQRGDFTRREFLVCGVVSSSQHGPSRRSVAILAGTMIPASYKIRDLTIRPATILAPMAGVTDTLFRRVIRGLGGCGLLMTEFTSSEGITRSAAKTQ